MKPCTTLVNSLSWGRTPWRAALLFAGALTWGATTKAQVVFDEAFTGGASSTGFTITQTTGTCGWTYGNPGSRVITGSGFDADFIIFDDDHCGNIGVSTGDLLSPVFDASVASNYFLTFDQSYHAYSNSTAKVDVWDGAAWNTVYTLTTTSVGYNNPAVPITLDITAAANSSPTAQIRFHYTGNYAYWWALDNIVLEGIDCLAPSGLAVTGITSSGGSIGWTDNGSTGYDWAVTTGAIPNGTNELAEGDGVLTTITGLNGNTSYTAWVRSDCGGDYSNWSTGVNFHTLCAASDIPYFEDFNATVTPAIPPCMSTQTISGNTWRTVTAVGAMTGHSANITYTAASSPAMDTWLYTQGLNLTGGTSYRLTYKYFTNGTTYHESMSVAYGTAANEVSMTNPLEDHPSIATTTVQIDTVNFTPATDGIYYVGFKCYSIADQNQLYLDDIQVIVTPECYPPIASTWIAPDCANSQYFVHVALTSLGDATSVDITSDYTDDPGGQTGITATGDYIVGPFADLSTVNISVVHSDDDSCTIALDPVTYDCTNDGKNALSFDGVNDRVNCGNNPSVAITGNTVTMEAWIYPTAWKTNTYQGNIVNSEGGNTGYMLRCGDNGKLDFNLGDGAAFHQMISPANTLTLNTWQYVAGTYDGDSMRMYVNGVQIMALYGVFNIGATGTGLVVGDWSNGTSRNFSGKIDEVRVWNAAVSGADILSHMNTAYCGNETGLVAYYKFDQGIANGPNPTVTTLNDISGYANNGTLSGFTLNGASSNWVAGVTNMGACVPVACPSPLAATISNATSDGFDISWADTGAPGYEYEVRSSGAPGSGATGLEASGSPVSGTPAITISGLAANVDYSVYVHAACSGGIFSGWSPASTFYLGYCTPVGTGSTHYLSSFVTTGGATNIDNSNSGFSTGGYGDFTSQSVSASEGDMIGFTATWPSSTYTLAIWVDWNNDFVFDGTGELVFSSGSSYLSTPASGTFTIPAGTANGAYRLRVRNGYLGGAPTSCGTTSYGEAEDYTLIVTGGDSGPTTLFTEDFDGGVSTAGFTVVSDSGSCGWTYDNPGARDISGANFDSTFAIFDSDHCGSLGGQASGSLVSPVFDASASTNYILSFSEQYHQYTNGSSSVDVWNGTTWTSVYSNSTVGAGYPNPAVLTTLDITAATGNSPTAQVRFHYNGNWAYWWAVDSINLQAVSCVYPPDLAVTEVAFTGGTISWTDNGSTGYEWVVTTGDVPDGTNAVASGDGNQTAITGLASDMDYYAFVRSNCGGSFSSWSPAVFFHTGYCVATSVGTQAYFSNFVTTGGVLNISNTSDLSTDGYGNFTADTVSQAPTLSVNFATTMTGGSAGTGIWVDWNNDVDFDDAGEEVYNSASYGYDQSGLIIVPPGTPEGNYRMRVRCNYYNGTPSACGAILNAGETEDYTFRVLPAPSCIAPTDVMTTDVTKTTVDFSWTASTSTPADGYQWEVRSSGDPGSGATGLADNGSTAAGVTNAAASGLTSETDYMIYVRSVCGAGDTSAWTIPADCHTGYCVAGFTGTNTYFTNFVTTGGGTNISNATGLAPNGYASYTSMAVSQAAGLSVNFATTIFGGSAGTAIWVDWNNDLDFNDANEQVFVTSSYGYNQTGTIAVPAGTPDGSYRMRILSDYDNSAPGDPCGIVGNGGEVEDYTFDVFTPAQCSGMPDPGATSGPSIICTDVPFTLAVENNTTDAGISYQWQISSDGTAWTDAPGASTTATYTTSQTIETWYRLQVTCAFGSVATSTPLQITMAPPLECYCTSIDYTFNVEPICNVTFADINNDSPSAIDGSPALEDFTAIVGHVTPGNTYTFSATGNTDGNWTTYVTAFFDWDGNGTWETVVPIGSMTNEVCATPVTADVNVPADAVIGTSHMRVVKNYADSPTDPCATYGFGQAEDYTLDVATAPLDCEGVANGPAIPGTDCIASTGNGGVWNDNCVCIENIGVGEIDGAKGFAIYPNPASSILYITTPNDAPVHVKVYDMVGTLVMEKDMVHQLDITKFATGSYTLVATDTNGGNERHARFMKQ